MKIYRQVKQYNYEDIKKYVDKLNKKIFIKNPSKRDFPFEE